MQLRNFTQLPEFAKPVCQSRQLLLPGDHVIPLHGAPSLEDRPITSLCGDGSVTTTPPSCSAEGAVPSVLKIPWLEDCSHHSAALQLKPRLSSRFLTASNIYCTFGKKKEELVPSSRNISSDAVLCIRVWLYDKTSQLPPRFSPR